MLLLLSSTSASFITMDSTDPATISACRDPAVLSCQVVRVDAAALKEDKISLPGGFELVREDEPSEHSVTFIDDKGTEATFSHSNKGISGEIELDDGTMFALEPCSNFEGCHVLMEANLEVLEEEEKGEDVVYPPGERALSYPEMRAVSALQQQGITDPSTMVTYSLKVYYTTDFAKSTEDIPTFVDNVSELSVYIIELCTRCWL